MKTKKLIRLYQNFSDDKCTLMATSLAYYAVFSLPGLLILVISFASFFFNAPEMQNRITYDLGMIFGADGAKQLTEILKSAKKSGDSTFASILETLLVIIGATGFVAQLQEALNICWGNTKLDEGGIFRIILKRLISLATILTVTFLLLISFSVNTLWIDLQDSTREAAEFERCYLGALVTSILFSVGKLDRHMEQKLL